MKKIMIKIEGVSKQYRLGQYGYGTLAYDLQSWFARLRKKNDPNSKVHNINNQNFRHLALNNINLDIFEGEVVGLIGGNGAGKSTLLKLISRITGPTAGRILLDGKVSSMLEVGTGFNSELTGRENIYMNGTILGMTRNEINSKINQIIEFSECEKFIDTPVKRYSSGMYVKLAFAVASHLNSEILIMDEVLAVGDIKFQRKCINKMRELARGENRTVIYVSHNMQTVRELCNRCIVLCNGEIVMDSTVEESLIYYEDLHSTYSTSIDFNEEPRELKNNYATLDKIEVIDKNKLVFDYNETVKIKMYYKININTSPIFAMLLVYDKDFNIIGSLKKILDSNLDKNSTIMELNCNQLCEGTYYIRFLISITDEGGEYITADWPIVSLKIHINKNEKFLIPADYKNLGYINFN